MLLAKLLLHTAPLASRLVQNAWYPRRIRSSSRGRRAHVQHQESHWRDRVTLSPVLSSWSGTQALCESSSDKKDFRPLEAFPVFQ